MVWIGDYGIILPRANKETIGNKLIRSRIRIGLAMNSPFWSRSRKQLFDSVSKIDVFLSNTARVMG